MTYQQRDDRITELGQYITDTLPIIERYRELIRTGKTTGIIELALEDCIAAVKDARVEKWTLIVAVMTERYDAAKRALAFHENRDHILGIEERRGYIHRINLTQDCMEDAQYGLRRAKAGL